MTKFSLPRSTPEAEGVSSAALCKVIDKFAELDSLNSIMILRHGKVIAEGWWDPYKPEYSHELFSLSKSFVSAAFGLARAEGKISLDDRLADIFPDHLPPQVDPRAKNITMHDLLTMRSGHSCCGISYNKGHKNKDWVRGFFEMPMNSDPGTLFCYDSGATFMVAAALKKVLGMNVVDYLQPRLFDPLGIEAPRWDTSTDGINLGGWGLWLKTEDIAKFAQLMLHYGNWNGRQILPEDYMRKATSVQADNSYNELPDWKLGYGYQFWRCQKNAFRGDGAFGQYALAIPDLDVAIGVTCGMGNMQSSLQVIWDYLVPAVVSDSPLPEYPAVHAELVNKLSSLRIPALKGTPADFPKKVWKIAENKLGISTVTLEASAAKGEAVFGLECEEGKFTIPAGFGEYRSGSIGILRDKPCRTAASVCVDSMQQVRLTAILTETPERRTWTFKIAGDGSLTLSTQTFCLFHEPEWEDLHGTLL